MAFDPDFLSLMSSLIVVKPFTGPDGYGAPGFGTSVANVPARIVYRTKILRTDVEDRILSTAEVWTPPAGFFILGVTVPQIHDEDEITLPGDSITRHVLLVSVPSDESGDYYQMVDLT